MKEPWNALTAPIITLFGYTCEASTRELEWVRYMIIINGITSCFMHWFLPQKSSPVSLFIARIDCTSMLAAIYGGISALYPDQLPIEVLPILLILPALFFDEIKGPKWFPATFGVGWFALGVMLYSMLPPNRLDAFYRNVFMSAVAAGCQIYDQLEPPKSGLGWIRRNVPLHAVWHVLAGKMTTELVGFAGEVLTARSGH